MTARALYEELDPIRLALLKVQTKEANWFFAVAPEISADLKKVIHRLNITEDEIGALTSCNVTTLYQCSD